MAKELIMHELRLEKTEKGFVLATSLVMLMLLTTLSIATYYGTVVSQQTSASAASSTQAYYYAETGLNYMAWALKNDAELDGYNPPDRRDPYGALTLNSASSGDRREWEANQGNPSKLDSVYALLTPPQASVSGQLRYFDNRDLYSRPVGLSGGQTLTRGVSGSPIFSDIYAQLSGYIRLDIDAYGNIVSSLSPYTNGASNHALPTHICHGQTVGDVPCNGAVVWLTAGDPYSDFQLFSVDLYAAPLRDKYGTPLATSTLHGVNASLAWASNPAIPDAWGRIVNINLPSYYSQLPCDVYTYTNADIACDAVSGKWLTGNAGLGGVHLVGYAIGYSDGKARKMIRMVLN